MRKWLRRIRGAIGMGLTWAVAWLGVGVLVGLVAFDFAAGALVINALASAAAGFLGGASFSVVLGLTERRRRFDQMSLPRFACWGAIGGCLVAGLQVSIFAAMGSAPNLFVFMGVQGLIGAGSAAGSLVLARSADDRKLLESGNDVAEIGLTEEEKRQLLGEVQRG